MMMMMWIQPSTIRWRILRLRIISQMMSSRYRLVQIPIQVDQRRKRRRLRIRRRRKRSKI